MKKPIISLLYLAMASFFSQGVFSEERENILSVDVTGAKPNEGQIIISVFNSSENYLKEPIASITLPANHKGEALAHFSDLEIGTYSIGAIYDEDSNNKLNTNFIGIPSELVGLSNGARGIFGPPAYEKTTFKFETSKTIFITLGKAK